MTTTNSERTCNDCIYEHRPFGRGDCSASHLDQAYLNGSCPGFKAKAALIEDRLSGHNPSTVIEDDPLPENPKAIHGRTKPTLALIPGGASIPISRVFELGASKYGAFNWRKDPVEAETYVSAAYRHIASWFDGEDTDPESKQPHIAHAAACMMILLDAMSVGKMIDNRPHKGTSADLIRALTKPLD